MKWIKRNNWKDNASYTEKYQDHIPCSLPTKLFILMIDLANQLFFTEEKMKSINSLRQFLKNVIIAKKKKKMMKKHLNTNLVMSTEDEERFQSSNIYWIYNK